MTGWISSGKMYFDTELSRLKCCGFSSVASSFSKASSQMKMSFKLRWWLFVCLCSLNAQAQDGAGAVRYRAPIKDVALLVDISASVRSDGAGHAEAQSIIRDIVSGSGFDPARYDRWRVDTDATPQDMRTLFAAYLGNPPEAESAQKNLPLTGRGRSFVFLPIGRLSTVLEASPPENVVSNDPAAVGRLIELNYPPVSRMTDQSTCFWYGMATAAAMLEQKSKDGYYLFVVSDEEDDPDYLLDKKVWPSDHSARDTAQYKSGLMNRYPPNAIYDRIERYFVPRGVGKYSSRSDFKQLQVARFLQRGFERDGRKIRIAWYAMGVVPEKEVIPPPPVINAHVSLPPPSSKYIPPQLKPRIELLGGWSYGREVADYSSPLLVWQVRNAEAVETRTGRKPAVKWDNSQAFKRSSDNPSSRLAMKPLRFSESARGAQQVRFSLVDDGNIEGDGASPVAFSVKIEPRSMMPLQILAVLSCVSAVAIFVLSWRSLKEAKVVRT